MTSAVTVPVNGRQLLAFFCQKFRPGAHEASAMGTSGKGGLAAINASGSAIVTSNRFNNERSIMPRIRP